MKHSGRMNDCAVPLAKGGNWPASARRQSALNIRGMHIMQTA